MLLFLRGEKEYHKNRDCFLETVPVASDCLPYFLYISMSLRSVK